MTKLTEAVEYLEEQIEIEKDGENQTGVVAALERMLERLMGGVVMTEDDIDEFNIDIYKASAEGQSYGDTDLADAIAGDLGEILGVVGADV